MRREFFSYRIAFTKEKGPLIGVAFSFPIINKIRTDLITIKQSVDLVDGIGGIGQFSIDESLSKLVNSRYLTRDRPKNLGIGESADPIIN